MIAQTMAPGLLPVAYFNARETAEDVRMLLPDKSMLRDPQATRSSDQHRERLTQIDGSNLYRFRTKSDGFLSHGLEFHFRLMSYVDSSPFQTLYSGTVVSSCLLEDDGATTVRTPPVLQHDIRGNRNRISDRAELFQFREAPFIHFASDLAPGRELHLTVWDVVILRKP